ncbi:MAG: hypothetical protein U0793_12340 [Gemmataceae bacterium]
MRGFTFLFGIVLVLAGPARVQADDIEAPGRKLAAFLDGMQVDKLWLSGRYVNWKTGEALSKPVTDGKPHTHCSAFAAAACERLGIYILRPPEHSETLLANAQFDWLAGEGHKHGWTPVKTAREAQALANKGMLVVATFKSPDPKKSGHIAIVRPSAKSAEAIAREGPQVIQAGLHNHISASLKTGFGSHPEAWSKGEVRYYAHAVKLE